MAKEERNYKNEFRKQSVLLYITMVISIFSCIFGLINVVNNKSKSKLADEYDISSFKTISLEEANNLFDSTGISVIYFGREDCESCINMLPAIKQAQIDMNFITKYIDISKVDRNSDLWKSFVEKLDIQVEIMGEQDTYGNFLSSKGVTPLFVIIKDGKQIAGNVGESDLTSYKAWLSDYIV